MALISVRSYDDPYNNQFDPDAILDAARRSSQGYNPFQPPASPPSNVPDPWAPPPTESGPFINWEWERQKRGIPPGTPPLSTTNTNPYTSPRYQGGGVNLQKWLDQAHTSPKYDVLRYLDQFNPQTLGRQGLLALAPDQRAGLERLGYQVRDEDKIFRNDIGEIDVLHGDRSQYGWRLTGVGNTPARRPGTTITDSGHGKDKLPFPSMNRMPTGVGAPGSQFTDPLTKQYEQLLQQQLAMYQQQQQAMQAEAQQKEGTRAQTEAAINRLMGFMNQRIDKLQGPAYTGSEQEVIRTQYLDPIERDRAATRQRALQNVGSRGFDPSSGIAQDLFNQIDRGFDAQRAQAQGDIAYKQITEQRSREQEAQRLLQYAAQAPEAAARGDMDFLQYLDAAINQPGQQGLATSAMLADLPVQRTQLGMQALGLGGQPQSGVPGALDLLRNAQYSRMFNQQQTADFWRNLGLSF